MSKQGSHTGLGEWLKGIGGGATIVLGLVTTLVGFVKLWQGDAGLVTLVLLVLGVLLVWLACLYFARFWQPEQQDESPKLVLPAPTGKPEKQQQKQEKKRKGIRRLAVVGLVLVPLLAAGGGLGWRHVQSLPSEEVVILVADFKGPDPEKYAVTEEILQPLRQEVEKSYEGAKVEGLGRTVTEQDGSKVARAIAERHKATIMVWGWYSVPVEEEAKASVHFEVLDPSEYLPDFGDVADGEIRKFTVSELTGVGVQLRPRLSSEINYLTLFTLGITKYAVDDWNAAIELFDKSLQELKASDSLDLSPTFFYKGNAHLFTKSFEEAITAYDAALKIKPDFYKAFNNKGNVLVELGKYDEAIAAYDDALKIEPKYYGALYDKGIALAELGKYADAIAAYDAALKIKPDAYEALSNKGVALAELGKYADAIAAYDAALKIEPNAQEALSNKGNALVEQEKYDEAIAAFDAALKIKPDAQEALSGKGNALTRQGQPEKAIAAYDAALKIKSDNYEALENKGTALTELEKYDEAITAYNAAITIQPSVPSIYAKLAVAYTALWKKRTGNRKPRKVYRAIT